MQNKHAGGNYCLNRTQYSATWLSRSKIYAAIEFEHEYDHMEHISILGTFRRLFEASLSHTSRYYVLFFRITQWYRWLGLPWSIHLDQACVSRLTERTLAKKSVCRLLLVYSLDLILLLLQQSPSPLGVLLYLTLICSCKTLHPRRRFSLLLSRRRPPCSR